MATDAISHIYRGPWINFSHGPILGATLTLGQRNGALLTSFIAAFVTIVGAQLWKILSFCLHQLRASRGPQDGLHHQQQLIFRNTSTPGASAWNFLLQTWYWRSKARHALIRTFPWAVFSICYLVIFTGLAVFSSEISKAPGPQRLLKPGDCGYWRVNAELTDASMQALSVKATADTLTASTYSRACYGNDTNNRNCDSYPVSKLTWTSDQNATCPFAEGLCVYGNTAAYEMTSQLIDSHHDLGINAPSRHRVQYQMRTTCAPMRVGKFTNATTGLDVGLGDANDTLYQVLLGPVGDSIPWTFMYNMHSRMDSFGYSLSTLHAMANTTSSQAWIPAPEVSRVDADTSIVFIAPNSITFQAACDDPVFSAHDLVDDGVSHFYDTDYTFSTVGCIEQHRICNPNNQECTPYVGIMSVINASTSATVGLTETQVSLVGRIAQAAQWSSVYEQTYTRLGGALAAQDLVSGLSQAALPATQWMIEAGGWFNTGLARVQQVVQEYATGPVVTEGSYLWQPDDFTSKAMCYSQMVLDAHGTVSFSILGMAIVFALGLFIVVLSFFVDQVVGWLQQRLGVGLHARMNWMLDDKLQVQKMLFQELGMGSWSDDPQTMPTTTEKGERFGGWDDVVSWSAVATDTATPVAGQSRMRNPETVQSHRHDQAHSQGRVSPLSPEQRYTHVSQPSAYGGYTGYSSRHDNTKDSYIPYSPDHQQRQVLLGGNQGVHVSTREEKGPLVSIHES